MKAFVQSTILIIVSLFVGLAAIEVALRLAGERPAAAAAATAEVALQKVIIFDPKLESRYKPGAQTIIRSQYGEFEVPYRFNDLGLRDREIPPSGPKSPFKILALGNSLVEGWGVPEDKVFLRVAEERLSLLIGYAAPGRVRIINGGISGYGAAQSFLFFRELETAVKPQAVVFFYVSTMVNFDKRFLMRADIGSDGLATGLSVDALLQSDSTKRSDIDSNLLDSSFVRGATQRSALVNVIASRLIILREQRRIIAGDPQVDLLAGTRAAPDKLADLHEPSLRHVAAIARYAEKAHLPFLLVQLPLPHQLSAMEWGKGRLAYGLDARVYPAPDRAVISDFCLKEKLRCISAFDVLQRFAANDAQQQKLFYDFDFHPNEYGSEILGRWVGEQLVPLVPR